MKKQDSINACVNFPERRGLKNDGWGIELGECQRKQTYTEDRVIVIMVIRVSAG